MDDYYYWVVYVVGFGVDLVGGFYCGECGCCGGCVLGEVCFGEGD